MARRTALKYQRFSTAAGARRAALKYQTLRMDGGLVQVVEARDGECFVGYKPNATGLWQHWGKGEGGYVATLARFEAQQKAQEVTR